MILIKIFTAVLFSTLLLSQAAFALTKTITITVTPGVTLTTTCATPDPTTSGVCDIADTAAIGTTVATFTVANGHSAPTVTDSTGQFVLKGTASPFSIVTAKSPLVDGNVNVTITAQ